MKKFLSMLLAACMVLSLCACGSKSTGDISSNGGDQSFEDVSKVNNTDELDKSSNPPKKVVGDRVPVEGADNAKPSEALPTDWELGEVDIETILTPSRAPLEKGNVKMIMTGVVGEDTTNSFGATIYMKDGDLSVMEFNGVKEGMTVNSGVFEVEEDTYVYLTVDGGPENGTMLYKLVQSEEGDDTTAAGDDGIEGFTDGMVDTDEAFDATKYTSCEYVGLIGDDDTFKAVDENGDEFLILINHQTGLVSGMNMTSKVDTESDETTFTSIRIEYGVDAVSPADDFDLTTAQEDDGFGAIMSLLYPIFMFVDTGDAG